MNRKLLKKYLLLASMVAVLDTVEIEANNEINEYNLTDGSSNILNDISKNYNINNTSKFELTAGVSAILNDTLNNEDTERIYNLTAGISSKLNSNLQNYATKQIKKNDNVHSGRPQEFIMPFDEQTITITKNESPKNFEYIESEYGKYITYISNTYGIDPILYMAMASQEFGISNNNIIQIEKHIWEGKSITAYNFEIEDYETMKINSDCFSDPYKNLKAGCMILQHEMYELEGNILAGLQGYNYGGITTKNCIEKYSDQNNIELDYVLSDQQNLDWIPYIKSFRNGNYGDPNYIKHVLSHLPENSHAISLKMIDGSIKYVGINIEKEKVYKK